MGGLSGGLAWCTWTNVRIELPEEISDRKLCIVRDNEFGWQRLTVERFIEKYAPTCTLVLT